MDALGLWGHPRLRMSEHCAAKYKRILGPSNDGKLPCPSVREAPKLLISEGL